MQINPSEISELIKSRIEGPRIIGRHPDTRYCSVRERRYLPRSWFVRCYAR
jgi:hypothetical protein